jgi:hypothetical protein
VAAIVLSLQSSFAAAQSEQEIEQSRLKGVEYLKTSQEKDGSWEFEGHQAGITALCSMALIENGVSVSDPIITRAQSFVRAQAPELTNTYDLALTILFLSRVGDRDDRSIIREMAARLIAGQNEEGGWSYTCPKASVSILSDTKPPTLQKGTGDTSCTQFAVLGLWISSRWNVNIDPSMEQVALRFIDTQAYDGGWQYNFWDEKTPGSAESMTFAGLFCLSVAKAARIRESQTGKPARKSPSAPKKEPKVAEKKADKKKEKPKPAGAGPLAGPLAQKGPLAGGGPLAKGPLAGGAPGASPGTPQGKPEREPHIEAREAFERAAVLKDNATFAKGLEKAGAFAAGIHPGSPKYFLWSVERLGVILGVEQFGATDWFKQGAQSLISSQQADGSWNGSWGNKCDTAFGVLFLRKANLGSDISRLLEGEPQQRFAISSRPDRPRFDTLVEAIKAAQPGETIRIDGNGPFPMGHLEFSQDVTLQAGAGYGPVFQYDAGVDADGRRSRPESDVNARHMLRVNAGTVTLEGIELRLDTPPIKEVTDWTGVIAAGGKLRMLNCSISEEKKNKMTSLRVTKPSDVILKNCLLVGGRAGLEIAAGGSQQVTLDNCVVFTDQAISVQPGEETGGELSLTLRRTAIQAADVFAIGKLTLPMAITCDGVAFKAPWLGARMLPAANDHANITWTGSNNLYDLGRWIGADGAAVAKVKDAKSFNEFFGGTDDKGTNRPIPFAGNKQNGAFSHKVRGEDFELPGNSVVYGYRLTTGVDPLVVGPGSGFLRFRDSFDYRAWQETLTGTVATK